jgi:hypothetical protein
LLDAFPPVNARLGYFLPTISLRMEFWELRTVRSEL